jgi:membrane protease YdiL (CAAX protease family)
VSSGDRTADARVAGRHALVVFATAALLVTLFDQIGVTLPAIGNVGAALVALLFVYGPVVVARWRNEDLYDYGFHVEPTRRGLITAAVAMAILFPVFAAGYVGFYSVVCASRQLAVLAPPGMCARFSGLVGLHAPALAWNPLADHSFSAFCAVQFVVVALPEELFFRGMLLRLLERRFPPKHTFLAGGVGLALVLQAAAFAVVHVPRYGAQALVIFFPGLLFGWMRSSTGSILASTVTHGASNIFIELLQRAVLR